MNTIYETSEQCDVNYNTVVEACKYQPWMGSHHFDVPGPDGKYGFGGPCLPKDIDTFNKMYDNKLLKLVQTLNKSQRNKNKEKLSSFARHSVKTDNHEA